VLPLLLGLPPVTTVQVPAAEEDALDDRSAATKAALFPPSPPTARLLQQRDLVYQGAFRVPAGGETPATYAYGGTAPTHSGRGTLYLVGHDHGQLVGEITIPTPGQGATLADLPRAAVVQPLTDILQGKRTTIDGDLFNGVKIGGIAPFNDALAVTAWSYYDAGPNKQTKTHFVTGQNFSALTAVAGPF